MTKDPTETTSLQTREAERTDAERSLARLDRLARLMDDQFRVPLTRYRIGLDPLIGLIPGAGDWVTWVVGVYVFWESLRLDAPRTMLGRMIFNIMVDLIVGYVPIAGDAFDAAYKAHRKNVDLLLEHFDARRNRDRIELSDGTAERLEERKKSSRLLRYGVGALVVLVLLGVAAVPIVLLWWLLGGGG
ncbi:MAG: DUF4112 domain-containing protein [Persicimonas sp.]